MTINASRGLRKLRALLLPALALLAACERPPVDTVQTGYRGTGMEQVYNPRILADQAPLNVVPADTPLPPAGGPPASAVFKNVRVLGDTSVAEFTRLMVSITAWVSPEQGCAYCHKDGEDLSSDSLYTKVVARRMLEMTRRINTDWKTHVADTGVTCYTCHRGQNVPPQTWVAPASDRHQFGMVGNDGGQNKPVAANGLSSLPYDPFTPFLAQANEARVIGDTALPTGNRQSTKQTEFTYALMMHMSQSLGVNCTYCHNSRSFSDWDSSSPQRGTAWYGIRMARDLNTTYIDSVANLLPASRLGPAGDAPKVSCATCHQGAFKPLYGAQVLQSHPALLGARAAPAVPADGAASAAAPAGAAPASPAEGAASAPAPR
jgi:photosynthetic reaction center cytochrome c subunit